jgi:hypothetical protein
MSKQETVSPKSSKRELSYQKTISTAELPFAAYLKTRYRLPLADIRKSSSGRVTWTFELQRQDERELSNEFYRGGMVAASDYFSELKNLKSMIYGR